MSSFPERGPAGAGSAHARPAAPPQRARRGRPPQRWLLALGVLCAGALAGPAAHAQRTAAPLAMFEGIGRPATPKEMAAWDIDVRPDFKGLPKGKGTVAQGQDIWEAKCASCHGIFGESNEVFNPLIGGTTAADVQSGRAARLTDPGYPARTTLMKLSSLSTLWDYIHRAMPWNAPKSLSHDEVYAVTAFMLNLGGVLPESFTLSDENIAEVQRLLPNRLGMTTEHGLWPGRGMGRPGAADVRATACMQRCATEAQVASLLPDHARNAHGNLAEQNRIVGPQVGADTTAAGSAPGPASRAAGRPGAAAPRNAASAAGGSATAPGAGAAAGGGEASAATHATARALAGKHNCLACHGVANKVVGPGLREVAQKHAGRADAVAYLARKISEGSTGVWGPVPMPPQTALNAADARALAAWVAAGAP